MGRSIIRALRDSTENERIVLNLLNSVDDGAQSQRRIAEELGIALGLVNAYLKRCIRKGLVKVSEAPARRYAYYLTPQGFSEKSRLTLEYLSYSFSFFRQAKADCAQLFELAKERNFENLVLLGKSDLAEIAIRDHCAGLPHQRIARVVVGDREDLAGLLDQRLQLLGLDNARRQRLVADDMDAGFQEDFRDGAMQMVRRHDRDDLDTIRTRRFRFCHQLERTIGTVLGDPELFRRCFRPGRIRG